MEHICTGMASIANGVGLNLTQRGFMFPLCIFYGLDTIFGSVLTQWFLMMSTDVMVSSFLILMTSHWDIQKSLVFL